MTDDTQQPPQVRVVLADDNQIVRLGLAAVLAHAPDVTVVGHAGNGEEALALARSEHPDVVLLDVRMPGSDGLSVLPDLAKATKVLMLTHSDEPAVIARSLATGATGYLLHGSFDNDELVRAVRDAADGLMRLSPAAAAVLANSIVGAAVESGPPASDDLPSWEWARLSPREAEVCRELVKGRANREIAAALVVEPKTIKNYLNNIFAKLGATSRAQAITILLSSPPVYARRRASR